MTPTSRNKRMRTSFKHHQLRTMKSYFAINQNPDAKDLKQLAQKTGLSKRVLQVFYINWFNKIKFNIFFSSIKSQRSGSKMHEPNGAVTSCVRMEACKQIQIVHPTLPHIHPQKFIHQIQVNRTWHHRIHIMHWKRCTTWHLLSFIKVYF